jgi:two-component system response regulator DesR
MMLVDRQPDLQVVAEGETGPDAVARFLEARPDLGVIDLLLPGLDGAAVAEAIRALAAIKRGIVAAG